jgi:adenine-specific DNA-methyltransferase
MEDMLRGVMDGRGTLETIEIDYKRYVGAQIGIHNPRGEKVGKISHLRNKEYLYILSAPTASNDRGHAIAVCTAGR